jgi:hypothetical protein
VKRIGERWKEKEQIKSENQIELNWNSKSSLVCQNQNTFTKFIPSIIQKLHTFKNQKNDERAIVRMKKQTLERMTQQFLELCWHRLAKQSCHKWNKKMYFGCVMWGWDKWSKTSITLQHLQKYSTQRKLMRRICFYKQYRKTTKSFTLKVIKLFHPLRSFLILNSTNHHSFLYFSILFFFFDEGVFYFHICWKKKWWSEKKSEWNKAEMKKTTKKGWNK